MTAHVLSIATHVPDGGMTQPQAASLAAGVAACDPRRARALATLYARTGIRRRGLVIADQAGRQAFYPGGPGATTPTTAARMARYADAAPALALPACRAALERARTPAGVVTHVIVASCTGFGAPGVDQALVHGLGLAPTVRRTIIGFMGCHAAVNALAVAAAFVNADPAAAVLVCCVEVCSLHFAREPDADRAIANALFADGAAAAVVARAPASDRTSPRVLASGSTILPESADDMTWRIGDAGFEMTLSPRVPDLLARHVPPWIDGVLSRAGLTLGDVRGWAVHPGGPRVVASLHDALRLPNSASHASLGVLGDHGNMSSPTVLFILDRLWRAATPLPWLAMAFGPGLAGEAVLLG
jgi:predicted naringenin-chalcone synthase